MSTPSVVPANAISEVWYTRCPVPTPVGLAAQLGYLEEAFSREGVALKSIIDSPDRDVRRSHFEHTLSWSFRHGGNVPPIHARSLGRKTRLVGITWTDEFQAIISLPGRAITTTRDLVGRRFGVARRPDGIVDFMRATALKGLESALSLEGLTTDQVEIVEIQLAENVLATQEGASHFGLKRKHAYGDEIAALIRGDVDAIYVKGTAGIAVANLIGAVQVAEVGFNADPNIRINSGSPRILTVDELLADERPDLVARLIEAIQRASNWAESHPEETRRFVAIESGATEEQVLAANGPEVHRHLGLSLAPELIAAVQTYTDFLARTGFIPNSFDVASWADHRAYGLVAPRRAA